MGQMDDWQSQDARIETYLQGLDVAALRKLTIIATRATPDDERDYGVEDGGERSRNILAARPRKLT